MGCATTATGVIIGIQLFTIRGMSVRKLRPSAALHVLRNGLTY